MDPKTATQAIIEGRFADLPGPCSIVATEDNAPPSAAIWHVTSANQSQLRLGPLLRRSRLDFFPVRIAATHAMLNEAHLKAGLSPGTLAVNLDDAPVVGHGIAFSSRDHHVLVPDPAFVLHNGYKAIRDYWAKECLPWERRIPVAFWRGGTSGHAPGGDWRKLPRIELCKIARMNPERFDAAISHVSQVPREAEQELQEGGLRRPFIPDCSTATNTISISTAIPTHGLACF
jgi:hypothetical protein